MNHTRANALHVPLRDQHDKNRTRSQRPQGFACIRNLRMHVKPCGRQIVARGLLGGPSEFAVLFPAVVLHDCAEEGDGIGAVSAPRHSLVLASPGYE